MARHTITVYRDFLANIYSWTGSLFFIGGVLMLFDLQFSGAIGSVLLGMMLHEKAENRASRTPSRYSAKVVGVFLVALQVAIPIDYMIQNKFSLSGIGFGDVLTALIPMVFAVPLLMKPVTNKPAAIFLILLVLQVILLVTEIIPMLFLSMKMQTPLLIFTIVSSLIPGYLALRVRAHAKHMTFWEMGEYF